MTFTNENLHYLYLLAEDGIEVVIVPPETMVELPSYFSKYDDYFTRDVLAITPTYTPFPIGAEVVVYSSSVEIDGEIGNIIEKDEISYKIDFGSFGAAIWFPYSAVELTELPTEEFELPNSDGVIFFI